MDHTKKQKLVKRIAPRSPTKAPITCRPYVSCRALHTAEGFMRNFSSQGAYVEISGKYEFGTILIVRLLKYPSVILVPDSGSQPRTICLAEVKWYQELAKGNGHRYGMGLKYLD